MRQKILAQLANCALQARKKSFQRQGEEKAALAEIVLLLEPV